MDRNRAKTKLKEMKTQSKTNFNSRELQHNAINREKCNSKMQEKSTRIRIENVISILN